MKTKEELDLEYNEAQGRLANAQAREAEAPWATVERAQAHSEVRQALDDIAAVEAQRAHPEDYEEKVTLVAPTPVTLTDSTGIEWQDGKAALPRSVAERYVRDLEGYEIEEA